MPELIWSTINAAVRSSSAALIAATTVSSSDSSGIVHDDHLGLPLARAIRSAAYRTAP